MFVICTQRDACQSYDLCSNTRICRELHDKGQLKGED